MRKAGLLAAALLLSTWHAAAAQDELRVRVTYYTLGGVMASGQNVHQGAAACSSSIPQGSVLRFTDGRTVTCLDTGSGINGERWVDVWMSSSAAGSAQIAGAYGNYTTVEVVQWGNR